MIDFISPVTGKLLAQKNGTLVSNSGELFPIVNDIPRFVPSDNYANAFGLQWKTYSTTQLDSINGLNISKERLERCLGHSILLLKDKTVLEAGCGPGRFTELLVSAGAKVHSIDLSVAVEVNKQNIGNKPNYKIAQADIYKLPFPKESFDFVICLGVVQHTPSSEKTIASLYDMVKPGGSLVFDHYKWRLGYYTTLTPAYRMILKELNPALSKKLVNMLAAIFFPLHWYFRKLPVMAWLLHRISPLIVYMKQYPNLDRQTHFELCRMDTYDQLTDYYKHLKTSSEINTILKKLNSQDIFITENGNGIEVRCKK